MSGLIAMLQGVLLCLFWVLIVIMHPTSVVGGFKYPGGGGAAAAAAEEKEEEDSWGLLYNAEYKRRAQGHNPKKVPVQVTRAISHYFKYLLMLYLNMTHIGITGLNKSYSRSF